MLDESMLYDSTSERSVQDDIYDRSQELDEEQECTNNMYCLGTVFSISPDTNHDLLLEARVHTEIFLDYPYLDVEKYAILNALPSMYFTKRIELLKLRIVDNTYYVLIKTFWIRIIQRTWKRVFKERQEWLNKFKRTPVKNIFQIQRTGNYEKCPTYYGCLFVKRHQIEELVDVC
jgi:hypothetical protein